MPYPGPSPWCVPTPHLIPSVWTVSHCSPRNLHLLSLPTECEGGKQTDLGVPTEWEQSHEQSKPSENQNAHFCQHRVSKGSFQGEDTSFPTSMFPPSQSPPLLILPRPVQWDFCAPRREDWLGHRVPFIQPSPQLGQGG